MAGAPNNMVNSPGGAFETGASATAGVSQPNGDGAAGGRGAAGRGAGGATAGTDDMTAGRAASGGGSSGGGPAKRSETRARPDDGSSPRGQPAPSGERGAGTGAAACAVTASGASAGVVAGAGACPGVVTGAGTCPGVAADVVARAAGTGVGKGGGVGAGERGSPRAADGANIIVNSPGGAAFGAGAAGADGTGIPASPTGSAVLSLTSECKAKFTAAAGGPDRTNSTPPSNVFGSTGAPNRLVNESALAAWKSAGASAGAAAA